MMKSFFLVLSVLFLSTQLNAKRVAPIRSDILDGKYNLVKIWDGEHMKNTAKQKSEITIDSKTTSFSAFFGCNRMSAEFNFMRYQIMPIRMISTEMFCNDTINNLETEFSKMISVANHFTIEQNIVKFYHEEQVVLEFKKITAVKKKTTKTKKKK